MPLDSSISRPRTWWVLPAFLLVALAGAGLSGCQQLFTTSLATALARDTLPIPANLSAGLAADYVAQAKANQDTKLANALLSNLVAQIGTPSPAKAGLESSAAGAALIASGVGSTLTGLIGSFTGGASPDLNALLATIQASATGNVVSALSYLDPAVIVDPTASGLGATDYAIAAIILASSAITPGTNMASFDPLTDVTDQPTFDLAKAVLLQATTLVDPGSASADLLNQFKTQFGL